MDDNLSLILKEFEQLKGQFIITMDDRVERLIAIGDDTEDYYYITYNGRKAIWHSCVGRIIPLKGYIRSEDYDSLIRLAKLNDYDQVYPDRWLVEWNNERLTWSHNHTLLSEVCWDLN
jgi:hypothetical protein